MTEPDPFVAIPNGPWWLLSWVFFWCAATLMVVGTICGIITLVAVTP